MRRWRGWPGTTTRARRDLDALYWGDPTEREIAEGWFFYPCLYTQATIAPVASFKDASTDAEDYDTRQVLRFAAAWGHWIANHDGHSLEQRRSYDSIRIDRQRLDFPPPHAMLMYGWVPR